MTSRNKTRALYLLWSLFLLASAAYYVAGMLALSARAFHAGEHVRPPFATSDDGVIVTSLNPEAAAAEMQIGDRLLNGAGRATWSLEEQARLLGGSDDALTPGSLLTLPVRTAQGLQRTVTIQTRALENRGRSSLLTALIIPVLPPLVYLLIGYWIVFVRPHDRNAWLLLLLLALPEVIFIPKDWWPGTALLLLSLWCQLLQALGPVALLFFGICFPEQWRLDARMPWLKWLLAGPMLAFLVALLPLQILQEFALTTPGSVLEACTQAGTKLMNGLDLLCVLFFSAALVDKLRFAATADSRRRLQVLCAGSVMGLGSLLLVFVLLPHLYPHPDRLRAVHIAGALLMLAFPFSLAYVVLVQRALDVRVLIRIGTRYAFARASLLTLEVAVVLALVVRFLVPLFAERRNLQTALPATILVTAGLLALFTSRNRLSDRVQQWLDRKFFREAYNAELVLVELSEQVRRFTEAAPLMETVSRRVAEILHVRQVAIFLRGEQLFELQQAVGIAQNPAPKRPFAFDERSVTIRNLARSSRPATLYREKPDGWFLLADEDERATLDQLHAELLLPLPGRDRLLGIMTLGPKRSEEAYSSTDLRLLQSVGTQTGLALEISEMAHTLARRDAEQQRVHREMEIAREVQERLYPQEMPVIEGLSLAGCCRPAQGIGGDYYDVFLMEEGLVGLAIGDISGKGVSAALLMSSLRAALRTVVMDRSHDLAAWMGKINQLVYDASAMHRYATFFFATYDPLSRLLRYVNAGHNPPLVVRPSGAVLLDGGGTVIGLLKHARYREHQILLQPGDLLLLYTDGISEALAPDGGEEEEWGEERMLAAARAGSCVEAATVLHRILAGADAFTGSAPQHDDMTLLLMKIDEDAPAVAQQPAGVAAS